MTSNPQTEYDYLCSRVPAIALEISQCPDLPSQLKRIAYLQEVLERIKILQIELAYSKGVK